MSQPLVSKRAIRWLEAELRPLLRPPIKRGPDNPRLEPDPRHPSVIERSRRHFAHRRKMIEEILVTVRGDRHV